MNLQRGGIMMNLALIFVFVIIGALMMTLVKDKNKNTGKTIGIASPSITQKQTEKTTKNAVFTDNLGTPDKITRGTLDEFGAGIESVSEFNRDINQDGKMDRITRTHVATGNDHDYDEYKIELNTNGSMVNITPKGFRTTHGADCALRLIQFHFEPTFGATIISRPFVDTWDTPSVATKTLYKINGNQIIHDNTNQLSSVCDVSSLF